MRKLDALVSLVFLLCYLSPWAGAYAQTGPLDSNYRLGMQEIHAAWASHGDFEWALALAYAVVMLAVVAYVLRLLRVQRRLEAEIGELKRQVCGSNGEQEGNREDTGGGRVSGQS